MTPAAPGARGPGAASPVDEIRTERLLMRRWRDSDREPFAALNADPEVMRHFPAPLTRAQSDALVDRIEAGFAEAGHGLWALDVGGVFVGFAGLAPMHPGVVEDGALEVGWRLARSAWGRGYATEAGRAAPAVAAAAGVEPVWSWTARTNTPSQAVMRRLGMLHHADVDHPDLPAGHPLRPHVLHRTPSRPAAARPPVARNDHGPRIEVPAAGRVTS